MNVTREVITDLWPVYVANEASADTRALVDEFLQQDPEFAQLLQENGAESLLKLAPPPLPPDRELQALSRTKRLLHGLDWSLVFLFFSIQFSAFAFARIVSDTSWDVSPKNFIITAIIAGCFWVAYLVRIIWVRRKVYRKISEPGDLSRKK
jgi:hypothetical protein